jgi:hypothetical protein
MRKLKLSLTIFVVACLFALSVYAAEFDKTVSVTGGTSQRLSAVLVTGGWAGSYQLKTMTICNPASSANTLFLGNASTDTTSGFPLLAGDCDTFPVLPQGDGYDSTQFWLYVATTQNAAISAHSY